MADSSANRTALWRQRLAGELPPVEWFTCAAEGCTRKHRGAYDNVCSVCWRKTEEGRNRLAAQARERRAK